ncbi:hypothetical protein ACIRLA_46450 [Streptomyces sp. NPDC102364]|uniref:hypothetical protein n=1 Tax=Streptomyces sp. NPDC102364 TaxID=3366161 RepID=UPI00381B7EA1
MMRLTKLDACGRVIESDCSQVTTDGFVTATLTMETEDGSEISLQNAAGNTCISDKKPDYLKYVTVEIEFCQVDPDLMALINENYTPVLDADGNVVGFQGSTKVPDGAGFALEIWSDVIGSDVCDNPDAEGAWAYFLLPYVTGGMLGDLEIQNDAVTFTITANTKDNNRWAEGPYDVVMDDTGTPVPLLNGGVDSSAPYWFQITNVAPPEAECGCQPVPTPPVPTEPLALDATVAADGVTVTATATNAKGDTVTFDWGDGTATDTADVDAFYTAEATHAYDVAGDQTVTATGSDSESDTATVTTTTGA